MNIHRIDIVPQGIVRRNGQHLSAQPFHQRRIFAHRVYDDNAVLGGKKYIDEFALGGKGFAAARGAEIQAVGRFQFLRSAMMTLFDRAFIP